MTVLLVLGSKPEPALPPPGSFDDLACANASGRSAAMHGLPPPAFTVISTVVASGKNAAGDIALKAMAGLGTETLYICGREVYRRSPLKRLLHWRTAWSSRPAALMARLRAHDFRYRRLVTRPVSDYLGMVRTLTNHDPAIQRMMAEKPPSTGVLAVVLGLSELGYDQVILSGFSFEITHAYANNPVIGERGTTVSKHANTDVAVLAAIGRETGRLCTTETIVAERAGLPLFAGTVPSSPVAVA